MEIFSLNLTTQTTKRHLHLVLKIHQILPTLLLRTTPLQPVKITAHRNRVKSTFLTNYLMNLFKLFWWSLPHLIIMPYFLSLIFVVFLFSSFWTVKLWLKSFLFKVLWNLTLLAPGGVEKLGVWCIFVTGF